jgi:hypothetical protein
MTNMTNLTRRKVFASLPAAAAAMAPAAATALSGLATGTAGDPIFAVLAEHREAMRAESVAYRAQADAEETIPLTLRSWSYRAGDEGLPAGCTDPPEWIAAEMGVVNACNRARDAELAVLLTPPTTLAGVVALLDHVGLPNFPDEDGSDGNDTILENASLCFRDDIKDAATDFLPMIVDTLRELLSEAQS